MSKLRVLMLGPYPPPRGGVQTNMLSIREELDERGHTTDIIAITRSSEIKKEPNVHHPANPLKFIQMLRNIPHDILHVHIGGELTLRLKLMLLVSTYLSRGSKIVTFHSGGFVNSPEGIKAKPSSLTGIIFRRFDRVIVVNSKMIEMFARFGVSEKKTVLILPYSLRKSAPATITPPDIEKFITRAEKLIISVGGLERDYDIPAQIRAFEILSETYPDAGLLIIGSGSLQNDIERLAGAKNFKDRIMIAGDRDREIVLKLIEESDVLLRTTLFDGDAISVREALFLGTPVVATDNGMRPAGVELTNIGNEREIAKAIIKCLTNGSPVSAESEDGAGNIRAVVDLYESV